MVQSSSNFHFLAQHSPLLADLGTTAERIFPFDPASCVLKLRILAETLTQEMAAQTAATRSTPALLTKAFRGMLVPQDTNDEPAAELLRRLAEKPATPAKRGRAAKAILGSGM